VRGGKSRNRVVDLFQLAKESLRLRQLRKNGAVCFGQLVCDCAGQFDESLAVAGKFVAALDFFSSSSLATRFAAAISLI